MYNLAIKGQHQIPEFTTGRYPESRRFVLLELGNTDPHSPPVRGGWTYKRRRFRREASCDFPMKFLVSLLAFASIARATFQASGTPFKSPVKVASGFRARVIFSNLTAPGGIAFDDKQNLLAVEIGVGVSAYSQSNVASVAGWERTVIIKNPNVTQGIQVDGNRLYVSTGKDVLVYAYDPATKSVISTVPPYPIIDGLPADGGSLRALVSKKPSINHHSRIFIAHNPPRDERIRRSHRNARRIRPTRKY